MIAVVAPVVIFVALVMGIYAWWHVIGKPQYYTRVIMWQQEYGDGDPPIKHHDFEKAKAYWDEKGAE